MDLLLQVKGRPRPQQHRAILAMLQFSVLEPERERGGWLAVAYRSVCCESFGLNSDDFHLLIPVNHHGSLWRIFHVMFEVNG